MLYEMKVGEHIGKCFRVGVLGNTRYRDGESYYLAVLAETKNESVSLGGFKSLRPLSLRTTAIIPTSRQKGFYHEEITCTFFEKVYSNTGGKRRLI